MHLPVSVISFLSNIAYFFSVFFCWVIRHRTGTQALPCCHFGGAYCPGRGMVTFWHLLRDLICDDCSERQALEFKIGLTGAVDCLFWVCMGITHFPPLLLEFPTITFTGPLLKIVSQWKCVNEAIPKMVIAAVASSRFSFIPRSMG